MLDVGWPIGRERPESKSIEDVHSRERQEVELFESSRMISSLN